MFAPVSSPAGIAWGATFALLLASVCLSDLRTRRIPNKLVLAIAFLGLAHSLYAGPSAATALARSFGGMGVGLAIWFPLYVLRMMGAGDVKFFAATATWLGVHATLEAAVLSAGFGGFLAAIWLVKSSGWGLAFVRVVHGLQRPSALHLAEASQGKHRLPYGVAMAAGLAMAAWLPGTLF